MEVVLVNYTSEPILVIYTAARTCYSLYSPTKIRSSGVSIQKMRALIRKVVNSGHHSVLEHVSFTFAVSGISRACSHQLVRHRIASYSQQSQRYVKPIEKPIVPPSITRDECILREYLNFMKMSQSFYTKLVRSGIPREDARFVLPGAMPTNILMTMNLRELMNVCAVRLCSKAQWEIRELFSLVKQRVSEAARFLGRFLVQKCISLGYCPEENGCGLMPKRKT